tara:strand:- start:949 stop:1233 length:285 start_codon:yes stop_codon:yes gene_type:complete
MFILTVKGYEDEGAFAIEDDNGERVLLMFEEEDDADRYVGLMEVDDFPEMNIIEVDDAVAIKACQVHNYVYNVITPEDIIVPPKNDPFRKNTLA